MWRGKGISGACYWSCCPRDPILDKRLTMDGWMDGSKGPSNWEQKGWSSRSPDSGRCEQGLKTVPGAELVSELWQCSIHRKRDSQDYSQQLQVTNMIISLCWRETAREIGTGVELLRTGESCWEWTAEGWGWFRPRALVNSLGCRD